MTHVCMHVLYVDARCLFCAAMRRKHGNNQDMDDDDDDDDEMCVTVSGCTAVTCSVRLPGTPP